MRAWFSTSLLALALAVGVAGCGVTDYGVREGKLAPEFSALTLQGETISLSSLKGKPVVVVFWASWCGPCMAEVPHVNAMVDAYGSDVHVVGVNMGEDMRTAERAVQARSMRYDSALDPRSELAGRYAVQSIPLVMILDAEGRIRYRGNGLPRRAHELIDGLLVAGS